MATTNQATLDIHVEDFSAREELIIKRLGEYRTITGDIRVAQQRVKGIGLTHEPRITAPGPERDYMNALSYLPSRLTDGEKEIAVTVSKFVNSGNLKGYASAERVANRLRHTYSDDEQEDMRLQDAYSILNNDRMEVSVHLTDTERVAEQRLREREHWAEVLATLTERKEIIDVALDNMKQWFNEQYLILWHRYVLGDSWVRTCKMAARSGEDGGRSPLTPEEYRRSRKKALLQFDKWAPGLS